MSRRMDLLRLAAEALEDGRDPLTTGFLQANNVTFDECMSLGEDLAVGARLLIHNNRAMHTGGVAHRTLAVERLLDVMLEQKVPA